MQYRKFGSKYFVRIDRGEEILTQLKTLCEAEKIVLAEVKALGAIDDFSVGLFDVAEKKYHTHHFQFPAEIVSLWGTVTTKDGEFYQHIHMSAADKEGRVWGGHLNSARVSATCEMTVEVSEGMVERKLDEDVGLNLFEFV
ncbi:MAG: DNA-binding protein [Synergistaceae bacterium]|nr:DNA-binding protein [Synergistaceae bacterium]